MSGKRRVQLVFTGRVQGVGFRAQFAAEARTQGLAGWVRNLDDGRVEALLQGPGERIDGMIRWVFEGMRFVAVADMEKHELEPVESAETFQIRP